MAAKWPCINLASTEKKRGDGIAEDKIGTKQRTVEPLYIHSYQGNKFRDMAHYYPLYVLLAQSLPILVAKNVCALIDSVREVWFCQNYTV